MDLEVRGIAASPRRQTQLLSREKKCQGWRPDTRAARGPRPPEVPCLDLGRLGDSDDEDGNSYVPCSRSFPHTGSLNSSSDWRTSLEMPHGQQLPSQQKTLPENLPTPTDKYKLKYRQYEADMKAEYKQHTERTAEKKKIHLQCPEASVKGSQFEDGHNDGLTALDEKALLQQCYTSKPYNVQHSMRKSEAEDVAAERKKQAVVEQVMLDQLCRNGRDACRDLIGFFFTCDKSLTVYEFRQFGKNRTNALPFIQKGVYQHQRGQKKGEAYDLSDFYIGANLTFQSVDHNLPKSIKQNPILTLRVIGIDEAAMDFLKDSSLKFNQEYSEQLIDDGRVFKKIQGMLRDTLSKRGVRVVTGLGKYFRHIDKNGSGFLSQADFKEALKLFHLEVSEQDFESLWLILDDSKSAKVDYGEFIHAIAGEMNEYRKAFVRKAYMKLDFNKTGSVPMVDIRKCYCAKKHPLVLAGKATEEEIKVSFLETLGESCSNPEEVSYSEFEDYYEGLSIGITDDDDFVNVLRNPWGI
ncbi:calcyphosin-2 isoform X3 [Tympanuchus pallidicinctus]|uniref:calcyphosin-2 isoform X3 n=1 Tax=Tympanuchus pallidicinctus TaxID=109042 RepID=UPI002286FC81|nr:calcyphosin-2 isoform X3 [Tympanuchus pallidicinctus]